MLAQEKFIKKQKGKVLILNENIKIKHLHWTQERAGGDINGKKTNKFGGED